MGYGCLQTTFCVFNALIALLAAASIGVGIWAVVDDDTFTGIGPKGAILTIIEGCIILVVVGIGCIAAQKNSKRLLLMFFVAMLVICVLEIAAAVLIDSYPNKTRDSVTKKFQDFIDDDSDDAKDEINRSSGTTGYSPEFFQALG